MHDINATSRVANQHYHASRTTSTGTNAVVPVPTRPYVNARICAVICSIHVYLPHRVQLKLDAKQRASPIHTAVPSQIPISALSVFRIPLCVQSSPAHFPAFRVNHPVKTPLTKYMLLTCNASESIIVTPIYDADLWRIFASVYYIIFSLFLPWTCSATGDIYVSDTGSVGAAGIFR